VAGAPRTAAVTPGAIASCRLAAAAMIAAARIPKEIRALRALELLQRIFPGADRSVALAQIRRGALRAGV